MIKPNGIESSSCRRWPALARFALALLQVLAAMACVADAATGPDSSEIETRVKAAFIFNFARFIEWPVRSGSSSVRIAVLGRGDLAPALEEVVRGKSVNGKPIIVLRIAAPAEADCCEILLIEKSESKHQKEIVQSLSGKPVLTVCNAGNCFEDGVMIAFQIVEDSVRFRINQDAAEHAGLKISSQLLKVAIPAAGKHL